MNKMKKVILILIIMLLIGFVFSLETYAALNGSINLTASNNSVIQNEEFSVYVRISNLQADKGIVAIGAVLEYDKTSLTLKDIEGENRWSDPFYSETSGKMSSVKQKRVTSDENVLKITFTANANAENAAWVRISNFQISDGDGEANIGGGYVSINIKKEDTGNNGGNNGENNKPGDDNSNNGNNSNEGNNSNSGNNSNGGNNSSEGGTNNAGGNSQNGSANKPNTGATSTGDNKTNASSSTSNKGSTNNISNNNSNIENNDNTNEEEENNENIVGDNTVQDIFYDEEHEIKTEELKFKKQEGKNNVIYIVCIVAIILILGIAFLEINYLRKANKRKH